MGGGAVGKGIFKKIRLNSNITLRQLEAMSGIGHSTISRIENEEISPTLYEIENIAHALKISPYELFDFTRT